MEDNIQAKLREIGKGICLIKVGKYRGTGFHYGSGWVMSVAHNFQDDQDTKSFHSLLLRASFTFNIDGKKFVFGARKRMAFIHHLTPGKYVDPHNKDIAMVKLGIQYEYGRSSEQYENTWEQFEQVQLYQMKLPDLAVIDINERKVVKNGIVYAIHYGGEDTNMKIEQQTVTAVNDAENDAEINPVVPTLELCPTLPFGASGCPILNQQYKLVGLLVCGDEVGDSTATDDALLWKGGIQPYIQEGVAIIAGIGSYMAYKPYNREIRPDVSPFITVYLMNGEVLNAPNEI